MLANQHVEITFEVELAGSGSAGTAPAWGPIIRACGFSETISASTSVTYAPVSSSFESCHYLLRQRWCQPQDHWRRGSFSMTCEVNSIPVISFTMLGFIHEPTDVANATPTYSNQATPVLFKNGNTSSFADLQLRRLRCNRSALIWLTRFFTGSWLAAQRGVDY